MCIFKKKHLTWESSLLDTVFSPIRDDCSNYDEITGFRRELAMESSIDGDKGAALINFRSAVHGALSNFKPTNISETFVRFISCPENKLDLICEQLNNNQICLSDPNDFNDASDPLLKMYALDRKHHCPHSKFEVNTKTWYSYCEEVLNHIRIGCFCVNDIKSDSPNLYNPLMWGHYADNQKGIAIEFKVDSQFPIENGDYGVLLIKPVKYLEQMTSESLTLEDAFFTKQDVWGYEKEYRALYFSEYKIDKKYYPIKVNVTGLYLGYKMESAIQKKIVDKINRSIPIYKMHLNFNNYFDLRPHMNNR